MFKKHIKQLIGIVVLFSLYVYTQRNEYNNKFDVDRWNAIYSNSQYCLPTFIEQHKWNKVSDSYTKNCLDNANGVTIHDPELYTLSGIKYVKGESVASINPETQPLTKYLFGLSVILLGNPLYVQTLIGLCLVIITYLIGYRLTKSKTPALIATILLLIDKLFRFQLTHAYTELFTTFLVELLILQVISGKVKSKSNFVIIGMIALSKSFSIGIIVFATLFIWFVIYNKKDVLMLLKYSWISILVYVGGYMSYFAHNHGFIDFIRLHIQILKLYKGYVPEYPKFEIIRIIFMNKWRTWYGNIKYISYKHWLILWPVSFIAYIYSFLVNKQNKQTMMHVLWISIYTIFISMRLIFPRYMLLMLPNLYILLAHVLTQTINDKYSIIKI